MAAFKNVAHYLKNYLLPGRLPEKYRDSIEDFERMLHGDLDFHRAEYRTGEYVPPYHGRRAPGA